MCNRPIVLLVLMSVTSLVPISASSAQTRPELVLQTGHTAPIRSVSFSPDGRFLATASDDNTAIMWDAASGTILRTFVGHEREIRSVSFSPDGKRLATGSEDKTAIVWDAASGAKLRTLRGHISYVYSVSFSPDGKRLATGSDDKTAIVWDVASGVKLRTLKGHTDRVKSVSFSPDGKRMATGSYDNTAIVWDVASGDKLRKHQGHTALVTSVSFSPDGKRLATASGGNTAIVWDIVSGKKLRTLQGHTETVTSVSFSPDGKRLATASGDKTAIVWDVASGDKLRTLQGHTGWVNSVSFSPDGKRLATASGDKPAVLWDVAIGAKLRTFVGHEREIWSVSFSPDGKRLATGSGAFLFGKEPSLVLWDATSGAKLRTLQRHNRYISSVSFSPDGRLLATASGDKTAIVWDAASGTKLRTFLGHEGEVWSASFSPNGKCLATASWDNTAIVWDVASGSKLRTLKHTSVVFSVSFSPDGKRVCTGSADGTAALWDTATGAELLRLLSLDAGRDWLVVTPDGLFDGSKTGMQNVTFRIGKGLDVRQVDDFFTDFYYPGLLAAIFKGERPRPAAKIALPPNVKFVTPANSATVQSPTQTIEVEASDAGGGVKSIALFLNGVRVEPSEPARQPNSKTIRQSFTVCLVQGDNHLEARAAGGPGAGEGKAEPIVLKYLRPLAKPNLYVLAIGIGNYQHKGLKLDYPVHDANSFADLFHKRGGDLFAKVAVTRLLDADATAARIEEAFKAIAQMAQAQDVLIVTLAGHGKTIGQRYYFLPVDFTFDDPDKPEPSVRKYGIAADEMAAWMRPIKAQKRAWFIDTCNSGGAIKQLLRGSLDRGDPFAFRGAVDRLNRAEGMFIIAASTKTEQAKENKELGHGLLSYSLLAAAGGVRTGPLKNKPAKPERDVHTLDIGTWLNYAKDKLPALMKLYYDNEQDVIIGTDGGQSFPLLSIKP